MAIAKATSALAKLPNDEFGQEIKFDRTASGASTEIPEGSSDAGEPTDLADLLEELELMSGLGLWAQGVVFAEAHLQQVWDARQGPIPLPRGSGFELSLVPLQSEIGLEAQTAVCIEELLWELRRREPLRDGPALTMDGRAVDLEDGAPIFFSTATSVGGGSAAQAAREARRRRRAAAAAGGCSEEGAIPAVSAAGVVFGRLSASHAVGSAAAQAAAGASSRAEALRQRVIARRWRQQQQSSAQATHLDSAAAARLCVRPDGRVVLLLAGGPSLEARVRVEAKRSAVERRRRCQREATSEALPIDSEGCLRWD